MSEFPQTGEKAAWRRWAKKRRRSIDIRAIAPTVLSRLASLPEWHDAQHILLYLSLPGELPVQQLAHQAEKQFYLPRCAPAGQLTIHSFIPGVTPMLPGAMGIVEPDPAQVPEVPASRIDLVVVPALLFSTNGMRLGYGGGYYDRLLKRTRPDGVAVGACPDALLVPDLPVEPHDIPVRVLVTQTRTIRRADTTEPTPRPYSG